MYAPVYYTGARDPHGIYAEKLVPDPDDLSLLSRKGMTETEFSLVRLLRIRKIADRYGYLRESVDAEIISRIKLPFSFFIFSLFSVGIGWFFRNKKTSCLFNLSFYHNNPFCSP